MKQIEGLTFIFERRRYGKDFFCWASVLNGSEALELGDPWPAANWPKRELLRFAWYALAGKVLTAPAICGECNRFVYHSAVCSQWPMNRRAA